MKQYHSIEQQKKYQYKYKRRVFENPQTLSDWQKILRSFALAVFVLTMGSFVMDVLLYARNGAFFHSFGYSIILLLYAFGWCLALWCGRAVVFFFLIFNFIVFCVFKEYYKVNVSPLDFYAVRSAYQEGLRAGLANWESLLDASFWIMAGVTVFELIFIVQRSFLSIGRFLLACIGAGSVIGILWLCGVFQWLALSLFLFPNLYTSYEQGLLYKITYPIESVMENPLERLNQIILPGNQKQVEAYLGDHIALSRFPKHIYLIQAESLTTKALTKDVMPFLSHQAEQGGIILFTDTNHYHCLGSANTDFMMMTGLDLDCTQNHLIVYFKYPPQIYQHIQTLPKRLQEAGYKTFFLHGFEALFFNRVKHYPFMGFNHVLFMENFSPRLARGEWGVSDKDVLLTAVAQTKKQEKTFSFIITASMHPPYESHDESRKPYPDPQTETQEYLNSASELDTALQLFHAYLPEDSLVLLYGDHNAPEVGGLDTPFLVWYKGTNPPERFPMKKEGFSETVYYINSLLTPPAKSAIVSEENLPKGGE